MAAGSQGSRGNANNSKDVMKELYARDLVAQVTHGERLREHLQSHSCSFYFGVDPTAASLHVGHLVLIRLSQILQDAGHRAVVVVGGGTARIGDPSGKTAMRKVLSEDSIAANMLTCWQQLCTLLSLSDERKGIMVDNAQWLQHLNYLDFISEVGRHFSVNRMLAAECFKNRLQKGLSFLELNYMLLQSYDYDYLAQHYGVMLQIGGNDQWSNMLFGMDLVRRRQQKACFALTCPLLVSESGKKMGKTETGTVWLDIDKTPVLDFYQYWRNVEDGDVISLLRRLTAMDLAHIAEWERVLQSSQVSAESWAQVKHELAFHITAMVHGEDQARETRKLLRELYQKSPASSVPMVLTPTIISIDQLSGPDPLLVEVLVCGGVAPSKKEARRLIAQRGIQLAGEVCDDPQYQVPMGLLRGEGLVVKKGKKSFYRLQISEQAVTTGE